METPLNPSLNDPHPEEKSVNNPGGTELSYDAASENPSVNYPAKPILQDKKGNVWVRSLTSLALYLALGYYFISHNVAILLILTAIVIFHELGHFFAMKMYDYKELGIFFIPLLGAYASGTKHEISQKQSAIILLAGPLPGILVGFGLHYLNEYYYNNDLLQLTARIMIFLNLLNLLPIYPLDGGQLLNRLFLEENKIIGKIFVVVSAALLAYFAWKLNFYVLLIFPVMMLLRMRTDSAFDIITKKIEDAGINIDTSYEDLPDADYWKIRNILIENNYLKLRNTPPSPPYEYSENEDKVVTTIQGLLQRSIIQDLSWVGKLFIILIWVLCFIAPFWLKVYLPFFGYYAR